MAHPAAARHLGVVCDGCQTRDFSGVRYRCMSCADYDLCQTCYDCRNGFHPPSHSFEAIHQPRSVLNSALAALAQGGASTADFAALAPGFGDISRRVVTIVEIAMEDPNKPNLDESQVAWWLARDEHLADYDRVEKQSPPWTCAICHEGLEAEGTNGWIVTICGGGDSSSSASASAASADHAGTQTPQSSPVPEEGHVYHEQCLRNWLVKSNTCPVCRRTPIVPEHRSIV